MNVVFLPVCSAAPSITILSGTPNSVMNSFRASPAIDFSSIGLAAAKKSSVANTCAYRFPSRDLKWPCIVSVYTVPLNHGLSYILSAQYLLTRGRIADRSSLCVVARMVFSACAKPMNHHSLKSAAVTVIFLSLVWKVCADGTSALSILGSCTCTADMSRSANVAGSTIVPTKLGSTQYCCRV